MMQQRVRFAPSPDRHHQGVSDELGRHRGIHRPANHTAGEEINDGGHIEPALRCPHIREVSDPFAVGSGRFEAAVEHIGSDGGDLPLTQIGRQSTPSRTGFESLNSRVNCRLSMTHLLLHKTPNSVSSEPGAAHLSYPSRWSSPAWLLRV